MFALILTMCIDIVPMGQCAPGRVNEPVLLGNRYETHEQCAAQAQMYTQVLGSGQTKNYDLQCREQS